MIDASAQLTSARIYIAGDRGMVGSAVRRHLEGLGCRRLIGRSSNELDLRDQAQVQQFFAEQQPEIVICCAARVGGIWANDQYPAEFLYDNLMMSANTIHAAWEHGARRLLYLGSTCIYPRDAQQPIAESALMTGTLESTNEAYALAKIAGLKLCQFYRRQYGALFHSAMPTNLYGPGDNYHYENSHVLPALIRRCHEAKLAGAERLTLWGSGRPRREFLHVDDLARAIELLLNLDDPPDWINVGTGQDISINELAAIIADVIGFDGTIDHDLSKPDGTPVKRTDTRQLAGLGWQPSISLREGIELTYQDFLHETAAEQLRTA